MLDVYLFELRFLLVCDQACKQNVVFACFAYPVKPVHRLKVFSYFSYSLFDL